MRRGSAASFPNEKIAGNLSKYPVNLSNFIEIYGNYYLHYQLLHIA